MHVADNARLENRKSSTMQPKIARVARILTIFEPKRSPRRKLFDEKNSNEGNERKVPEKNQKIIEKKFEKFPKSILTTSLTIKKRG